MCWAPASGFVLARPASESPELLELDEDPELPLELSELPEPGFHRPPPRPHTPPLSVRVEAPQPFARDLLHRSPDLPRTCRTGHATHGDAIAWSHRSLFPVGRVSAAP